MAFDLSPIIVLIVLQVVLGAAELRRLHLRLRPVNGPSLVPRLRLALPYGADTPAIARSRVQGALAGIRPGRGRRPPRAGRGGARGHRDPESAGAPSARSRRATGEWSERDRRDVCGAPSCSPSAPPTPRSPTPRTRQTAGGRRGAAGRRNGERRRGRGPPHHRGERDAACARTQHPRVRPRHAPARRRRARHLPRRRT